MAGTGILRGKLNRGVWLIAAPPDSYEAAVIAAMKEAGGKVGYVTFNKTEKALEELFEREGVGAGRFFFVDCISKAILFMGAYLSSLPDCTGHCRFISYPGNIPEIEKEIARLADGGYDWIAIDSVTNMLVYGKPAPTLKFLSGVIGKARSRGTKVVLFAHLKKENAQFIEKVEALAGKAIVAGKAARAKAKRKAGG